MAGGVNTYAEQWLARVQTDRRISGGALRVLWAIAERSDSEGLSRPGLGALSSSLGINNRNVRKAIVSACYGGWLIKERPADPINGIPVTYRLALPERWQA
jgi:hypothetical protein